MFFLEKMLRFIVFTQTIINVKSVNSRFLEPFDSCYVLLVNRGHRDFTSDILQFNPTPIHILPTHSSKSYKDNLLNDFEIQKYNLIRLFNGTHFYYGRYSLTPGSKEVLNQTDIEKGSELKRLPTCRLRHVHCIVIVQVITYRNHLSGGGEGEYLACNLHQTFLRRHTVLQSILLNAEVDQKDGIFFPDFSFSCFAIENTILFRIVVAVFTNKLQVSYTLFYTLGLIKIEQRDLLREGLIYTAYKLTNYYSKKHIGFKDFTALLHNNLISSCFNSGNKTAGNTIIHIEVISEFDDKFHRNDFQFVLLPNVSYELVTCGSKGSNMLNTLGYFSFVSSTIWYLLLESAGIMCFVLISLSEENVKIGFALIASILVDVLSSIATVQSTVIVKRKFLFALWILPILFFNIYYCCIVTEISTSLLTPTLQAVWLNMLKTVLPFTY